MRTILSLILCLLVWDYSAGQDVLRSKVEKTYLTQVGIREQGVNSGIMVNQYLAAVNQKPGAAWCAAFVSWVYTQNGVPNPKSAWSPSWFAQNVIWVRDGDRIHHPMPGDVFGIYFLEKKRVAHIGFIHRFGEKTTITVEGNTNEAGSREGDGVYMKRRPTRQLYKISRYIHEKYVKR